MDALHERTLIGFAQVPVLTGKRGRFRRAKVVRFRDMGDRSGILTP